MFDMGFDDRYDKGNPKRNSHNKELILKLREEAEKRNCEMKDLKNVKENIKKDETNSLPELSTKQLRDSDIFGLRAFQRQSYANTMDRETLNENPPLDLHTDVSEYPTNLVRNKTQSIELKGKVGRLTHKKNARKELEQLEKERIEAEKLEQTIKLELQTKNNRNLHAIEYEVLSSCSEGFKGGLRWAIIRRSGMKNNDELANAYGDLLERIHSNFLGASFLKEILHESIAYCKDNNIYAELGDGSDSKLASILNAELTEKLIKITKIVKENNEFDDDFKENFLKRMDYEFKAYLDKLEKDYATENINKNSNYNNIEKSHNNPDLINNSHQSPKKNDKLIKPGLDTVNNFNMEDWYSTTAYTRYHRIFRKMLNNNYDELIEELSRLSMDSLEKFDSLTIVHELAINNEIAGLSFRRIENLIKNNKWNDGTFNELNINFGLFNKNNLKFINLNKVRTAYFDKSTQKWRYESKNYLYLKNKPLGIKLYNNILRKKSDYEQAFNLNWINIVDDHNAIIKKPLDTKGKIISNEYWKLRNSLTNFVYPKTIKISSCSENSEILANLVWNQYKKYGTKEPVTNQDIPFMQYIESHFFNEIKDNNKPLFIEKFLKIRKNKEIKMKDFNIEIHHKFPKEEFIQIFNHIPSEIQDKIFIKEGIQPDLDYSTKINTLFLKYDALILTSRELNRNNSDILCIHNPFLFGNEYLSTSNLEKFVIENPTFKNIDAIRFKCDKKFGQGIFDKIFDHYIKITSYFENFISEIQNYVIPPTISDYISSLNHAIIQAHKYKIHAASLEYSFNKHLLSTHPTEFLKTNTPNNPRHIELFHSYIQLVDEYVESLEKQRDFAIKIEKIINPS